MYEIADSGGLLVAVPLEDYPNKVKFSTDEGHCWHVYQFTSDPLKYETTFVDLSFYVFLLITMYSKLQKLMYKFNDYQKSFKY